MRALSRVWILAIAAAGIVPVSTYAQSAANLIALQGLTPVSVLDNTPAGKAALAANYTVTGAIQSGAAKQPLLLSFAQQQQLALRDAFITSGNATELSDGLGTKLGGVYQSLTSYTSPKVFANISPDLANLFAYSSAITGSDANSGKYFFANGTTDGTAKVSAEAAATMSTAGGVTDIFGKAYGLPAGDLRADQYGNSRPYQTESSVTWIDGKDYFGANSSNTAYLYGPLQNLTASPSFPSGHTTYGYTESLLLALMVPERFQQEITRAAEYGNDRIIVGAHYAMDVLAGRTLALHDVAQLLANNPAYIGHPGRDAASITDFPAALKAARADLIKALQAGCGNTIAVCATQDKSRFSKPAANAKFYNATQTYGLPVVYPNTAAQVENVAAIAPEAGYLLTTAFPYLTLARANDILTETEGPGGGFLDNGSAFGIYSRLDLYAAAGKARQLAPQVAPPVAPQ